VLAYCGFPYFTSLGKLLALTLAIVVGILETPFLCICNPTCQKLSMKLEVFEKNLLLRGGLYVALGVFALLICTILADEDDVGWLESHWSLTLSFLLLVADGAAYIAGHCRHEGGEGVAPPTTAGDAPVATVPPANP
jgi:predicted membrane channel-forming protein YqfA (hemolysin III family)